MNSGTLRPSPATRAHPPRHRPGAQLPRASYRRRSGPWPAPPRTSSPTAGPHSAFPENRRRAALAPAGFRLVPHVLRHARVGIRRHLRVRGREDPRHRPGTRPLPDRPRRADVRGYTVFHRVMHAELDAVSAAPTPRSALPAPVLEDLQASRAVASALPRSTTDIDPLVAARRERGPGGRLPTEFRVPRTGSRFDARDGTHARSAPTGRGTHTMNRRAPRREPKPAGGLQT